jgi:hypothetical protein
LESFSVFKIAIAILQRFALKRTIYPLIQLIFGTLCDYLHNCYDKSVEIMRPTMKYLLHAHSKLVSGVLPVVK